MDKRELLAELDVGKTKVKKTKASAIQPLRVNARSKVENIKPDPEGTTYKCSSCGTIYKKQKGAFLKSHSFLFEGNNGYTTMCRACAEELFEQLVVFYSGNEEHALEHICRLFDWYYYDEGVAKTMALPEGRSKVAYYPTMCNLAVQVGTSYLDTIKDRHIKGENVMRGAAEFKTVQEKIAEAEAIKEETLGEVPQEAIKLFGYGSYTDDEYKYLYNQYIDWTTRYECKTKAQEELYNNLCVAQLAVRRAQQKGTAKEMAEAMKMFQDLLGTINIKPSQSTDDSSENQNSLGALIKQWEDNDPIMEPLKEWQDIDGIHTLVDTYFLGHMAKLVHVENDNAARYEAEMAKYTVAPPSYDEDDVSETSILDKYSDKGGKDDTENLLD